MGFFNFPFSGSLCRDPEKFLCVGKDFSGTDINHSDIKNALVLRNCKLKIFCLLKIILENSQNFLRRNACEIKNFSSTCQKNGKTQAKLVKTA